MHLRIEEAGGSLDNTDGLVVDLLGEDCTLYIREHGSQVESQVLGVHLGCEAVGQSLLLASWDRDVVACGSQIADNLRWNRSAWNTDGGHERAANKEEVDRAGLMVGNGQNGLSRVSVDELHTKHFGVWERCGDLDGDVWRS